MPSHRHHLLALLLFAAPLAMTPSSALAQGSAQESMALQNYEKAKQAYGAGEFELAAELLQKAYAEDPDLIYQYNRIRALQAMGSFDEALKTIELFKGPMSRDKAQRFTDLDELEAQIKAEKIEFEKKQTKEPDVKEPDVKEPDVKEPDIKEPITPPVVDNDPGKAKRTTGWILLGSGVVAIAGTSPFWSGLAYKNNVCFDADNTTGENPECFNGSDTQTEFEGQLQRDRIIGGVGIGVGAILGVTGLIMVLKNGKPSEPETSSVTFTPTVSRDRAGASMLIRF